MKIVKVQFFPWDKVYHFDANGLDLSRGDKVIVETDLGRELGEVVGFIDSNKKISCKCPSADKCSHKKLNELPEQDLKPILRLAGVSEAERNDAAAKNEAVLYCRETAKKHGLPMKIIDAHFSFDGSRLTFAFIADGRIDFRELVKDLTRHFSKTIRLHQVGIRDEAKIMGDLGHCGRSLCCRGHLQELVSITSEMADIQQCGHRGSDRISGVCGRLMCCLAYEEEGYEELAKKMPPIGTKVNVDGKRGIVVGHRILKQCVNVEFPADKEGERTVAEVDLNRKKK